MNKLTKIINLPLSIEYRLFNKNPELPLVVYLHGSGEIIERLETQKVPVIPFPAWVNSDHRKDFSYLIPILDKMEKWNPLKIKTLIDELVETKQCNDKNMFIIGHSWGARGAWDTVYQYPDLFKGIISISGVSCSMLSQNVIDLPALIVHGTEDKVVDPKYSKDMYEALGGDKSNIHKLFLLNKQNHGIDRGVINNYYIWKWMKALCKT